MNDETVGGWPIRRWLALLAVVEAGLLFAALIGGGIALHNLNTAKYQLLDVIAPRRLQAIELSTSLLNQETGIRGYLLGKRPEYLAPYNDGVQTQGQAVAELQRLGAVPGTELGDDLDAVLRAASAWRDVAAASVVPGAPAPTPDELARSKTLFDAVRAALGAQEDHLAAVRDSGRADLDSASAFLTAMAVAISVLVVLLFLGLSLGLRRAITRPILRLAGEVREVSDSDIHRPIQAGGPRELAQLGVDIEAMRLRIVDEIGELERAHAMLDVRTRELERSNSDLEQFAYVASHDLQEPLRKVASFCQLLQRRYQGLLDERGEQYIEYAVDGAKRMQNLINDLLAFSQVGRGDGEYVVVGAGKLLDDAIANLEVAISLSGARIVRGELPDVRVEVPLMTAVFQNLVGNAVKFRGEEPPVVRVDAMRDGDEWVFSVADNGIGIEAEYAERIFVLFQRLHSRSAYPGTGIGLPMCRRIVEYHGGRIWLDTGADGTTFRFTLPALPTSDGPRDESVKTEENEDV
jgi:signal transduction histidine kinase